MPAHRRQAHGSKAAALRAIRVSAELAGRNPALQIRGNRVSGLGKNACFWGFRRMQELLNQSLWHIEFRKERSQAKQFFYGPPSFLAGKNLRRRDSDLRREYAHPNLPD